MPKICYIPKRLGPDKLVIVRQANAIIEEYQRRGYQLSLRQLYYQFIARDLFPKSWADPQTGSTNNMKSYKKLQDIISDARLAGLVDWEAIVDLTRQVKSVSTWASPPDIIDSCVHSFKTDKWEDQDYAPEVWVEKDAMVGVVLPVCREMEIPFLSCRGYTSASEVWGSARRLFEKLKAGKRPIVFHLGDHDPSGIDMTRDIQDRFNSFTDMDWMREVMKDSRARVRDIRADMKKRTGAEGIEVRRLALNMPQVKQYDPPPNPAKTTDARYKGYEEAHGDQSWELDALDPAVIGDLIRAAVESVTDRVKWKVAVKEQEHQRSQLRDVREGWDKVSEAAGMFRRGYTIKEDGWES